MKKIFVILLLSLLTMSAFAIGDKREVQTHVLDLTPLTTPERDTVYPYQGKMIWNLTTNQVEFYDGVGWNSYGHGIVQSLNGLADISQSFATGVFGSDFNISSASGVHTFNLPVASASNSGKLSSIDWVSFNSKQDAGNYVTALTGDVTTSAFAGGSAAATISNDAITSAKILDGAVGSLDIADNSISSVKIIDGSILSADIFDGTIVGLDLADGAVDLMSLKVTGVLPTAKGGTGISSSGASGNILTSNGTNWVSQALNLGDYLHKDGSVSITGVLKPSDSNLTDLGTSANSFGSFYASKIRNSSNVTVIDNAAHTLHDSAGVSIIEFAGPVISVTGKKISNLANGVAANDAVNKSQLDAAAASAYPAIFGSRASARLIQVSGITTGNSHMSSTVASQDVYVCGSNDGVACNTPVIASTISAGTVDGQRLCLNGRSANGVTLSIATTNVELNGIAVLTNGKVLCMKWDGTNWLEITRNF